MQICKNQGECNPSDNGVRVVHRFPLWPNNSASIFTVTKFRLGKDKLPSFPLYPCHCTSSCVRDNGISHCFIHKCDVTINRDRGQEAHECMVVDGGVEGRRDASKAVIAWGSETDMRFGYVWMMYPATTATCNLCRPLARLQIHEEKGSDEDVHRRECILCLTMDTYIVHGILHICVYPSFAMGKADRIGNVLGLHTDLGNCFQWENDATGRDIFVWARFDSWQSIVFEYEAWRIFFFSSICEYFFLVLTWYILIANVNVWSAWACVFA